MTLYGVDKGYISLYALVYSEHISGVKIKVAKVKWFKWVEKTSTYKSKRSVTLFVHSPLYPEKKLPGNILIGLIVFKNYAIALKLILFFFCDFFSVAFFLTLKIYFFSIMLFNLLFLKVL